MMAVLCQKGDCWMALMVLTTKVCSSRGSEFPAWASWKREALRKLTAGMFPAARASVKSCMSYWWLAASVVPTAATEVGRTWLRLAVLA